MKVTHYGEDYCKVQIGETEYEVPIQLGKSIDLALHRSNVLAGKNKKLVDDCLAIRNAMAIVHNSVLGSATYRKFAAGFNGLIEELDKAIKATL